MKKAIVVPIKTNNQRLPGKNTMILHGKPLHDYLFDTLKSLKNIEIYVHSSDKEILEYARKKYQFKTIKRPDSLNSPETSGNDLIKHALSNIDCDVLGQFFVTTPFLKKETIYKSFSFFSEASIESCFGVYPVFDRFWMLNSPVNHEYKKLVGTQYMKSPLLRESGFYVFRKSAFLSEQSRITENFKYFQVEETECIDIDTLSDFLHAEAFLTHMKKGNK